MRRSIALLVLVAAALAAAQPASAQFRGIFVAGHGTIAGGAGATVAAFELNGHVGGFLSVESAPGFGFVSRVTCIRVVAGRVLVGGVIVRAPTATIGHTSLIAIEDGGPTGPDLLGLAFSITGLDSCPAFALPMHPVQSGNFFVLPFLG